MAVGKEVKTKITSVKSTQKITSAMEMVAASKMRRAQERMALGKPYAQRIRDVVSHIANANAEYSHQYMTQKSSIERIGLIVISTDRGLCGGLNINLFKAAVRDIKTWTEAGADIEICTIGSKAATFFSSVKANIVATVKDMGDKPAASDLVGSVKVMLDAFDEGRIDQLFVIGNKFVNTMTQKPEMQQLLQLEILL